MVLGDLTHPFWPASAGAAPSLTQQSRLGVGPQVSASGDGPGAWPLPGLSREEEDLPEEQQKAAHQHLFHLQELEEGRGCDRHNRRRGQGEKSGCLPELWVQQTASPSPRVSHMPRVLKTPSVCVILKNAGNQPPLVGTLSRERIAGIFPRFGHYKTEREKM